MRRLLGCLVVSSWLLACGGDDSSLFGAAGEGGGAGAIDAGQHAGGGQSAGAGGASGGIGPDGGVGPHVSSAGSGGGAGATSDGSDISVAPSDASSEGPDGSDAGAFDGSSLDATNSDAAYCTAKEQCPTPTNVCLTATCGSDYACGTTPVATGTALASQVAGDCKRVVCDGNGSAQSVADDLDLASDGNECTTDGCNGGNPTHTPIGIGTPCSAGYCNALGICVQCISASQCGAPGVCATPTCNDGVCGISYTAEGTHLATQTTGDCKVTVCNATGGTKNIVDDTDTPDDSKPCTDDTCGGGIPGHAPRTGQTCGASGVCNDQGNCVGCNSPADCSGTDDFCKTRTCNSNTCGLSLTAAGTKLPDGQQTDKDCKKNICDADGNIQTVADTDDLPVDDNVCTLDQCSGSTPQHPGAQPGTTCGAGVCDGAGTCVQCVTPANCPATGNACVKPTCDGHVCGVENYPADTACGAGPSCLTGQEHAQDKCNSSGVCVAGSSPTCSPYACGSSACKTSCASNGDCAAGYGCDTGLGVCTNGPKCTDYCNTIQTNCTGSNAQYFSMEACIKTCATLPRGTLGDGGGNSVACRLTHAGPGYAAVDPVTHCPHAGPGGAGVCSASNCDGFCTIALATCKTPNPVVFPDMPTCLTTCGAFHTTPAYNASISSGDSFACRMWHLTAATLDGVTHCPHIQAVSATCF